MIYDLPKMDEGERTNLLLCSTHFNIHYGTSKNLKPIFSSLLCITGAKYEKEVWMVVTNVARMIKWKARSMSVPRVFSAYKGNIQRISWNNILWITLWIKSTET